MMRKYLMTGIAAIALGGLFSGYNNVDDINGGNSAEFDIVQNYENAFITRFGQPDSLQTWGFGSSANARTRGAVDAPRLIGASFNATLSAMSDRLASAISTGTNVNIYFSDYTKFQSWWGSRWNDTFYQISGSGVNSNLSDEYLNNVKNIILEQIPEGGNNLPKAISTGYSIITKGGPVTLTPIYHNSNSGDKISYYYYPANTTPTVDQIKAMKKYTIGNMADPQVCNTDNYSFYRKTYTLVYVNDQGQAFDEFPEGYVINFVISNTWVGNGNLTIYQSGGMTVEDVTPEPEPEPTPEPTPSETLVPGDQIFKFVLEANKSYYCGEYAVGGPYDQYFVRMGNGGQQDHNLVRNDNYNDFVSAKADSKAPEGYSAYTAGNNVNGSLTTIGSTVYYLQYKYYNSDGKNRSDDEFMARVGIVINEDTPLYVMELDDKNATTGTAVEGFNGKTYSEKTKEVIEFRIKQNKTYAIYATGSKLGFYGCEVLYENSKRSSARTRGSSVTDIVTAELGNNPEFYGDGRLNSAIHSSGIDQWNLPDVKGYGITNPETPHVAVFSIGDKNYVGFEDWKDFDYNDVIFEVTGTEGGEEIEVPDPVDPDLPDDPGNFVCRIIAEDLTVGEHSDFDFNDVVFDVFWNGSVTTIRLLAAGGELPLYIGSVSDAHEVHKLFGFPNSYPLINTNWSSGATANPVDFTIPGSYPDRASCKNIPVYVTKKGENILLKADQGKVASKVCVGRDYEWCDERVDIDKKFRKKDGTKLFQQYVIGNYGDNWDAGTAWYQYRGQ